MPETTPYSDAEAYAVLRNLPEPGIVQAKVVELLQAQLNAQIAYANEALIAAGQTPMYSIASVLPAPATIGDALINCALVGLDIDFEVRGSGLIDTCGTLPVYLVDRSIEVAEQQHPIYRRGLAVIAVLHRYLTGYYDANGNKLWHVLKPLSMTQLPETFKDYAGVTVNFHLEQKSAVKQDGTGAGEFWPAHA